MKFNRHRYQNDTPGDTGTGPCANAVNKTWPPFAVSRNRRRF